MMINKKIIRNMIICFVVAAMTVPAFAVTRGGAAAVTGQAPGTGYAAKLYNADNGLPTSDANALYSSSDGFIWIGGYSGLIRYDGTNFERQDSSGGITNVNTLFEDSRNRLWVGTNDNGIVYMQGGYSEHFSFEEGLLASAIRAISEDSEGNILIGTTQGLYYLDTDKKIGLLDDSPLKNTYISSLKQGIDGAVYGHTKDGSVFRVQNLKMTDYYSVEDMEIGNVTAIFPSPEKAGEVWLGTDSGHVYYCGFNDHIGGCDPIPLYYRDGEEIISTGADAVAQIGSAAGRIWVVTNSMIFYADKEGRFRQLENIPLNSGIGTMTEDWEGNIWFTSTRQGVMKIAANRFLDLTERVGLEPKVINSVCKHNGYLYIGTETGLQIVDKAYNSVSNDLINHIGNARIRCISGDSDGNLWISTYTGDLGLVCYSQDREIKDYTVSDGLPDDKVRCTTQAPGGEILVATNGGLAVIKDGRVDRIIDEKKGMKNTMILTAEATADGRYYLGTDGDGIYVLDGNKMTHLSRKDGLTSDVVMRIKEDRERDVLWIVTSNSIEYFKDGHVEKIEGFPYTNNYDIYFDNAGNAWVLASNGIYVVNASDMIEKKDFDYVFYNVADGLPSVPTGNSFSFLDNEGDLYISGRNGVSCVNIDDYSMDSQDIMFSIPYIEADGERYYPDKSGSYVLPSSAKNITVFGYALTFSMHDPQIEYYMEGADKKPAVINKSDMNPMRYTNLRGGEYKYTLALIDGSTHEIRQSVSCRIVKERAFYEQIWFYLLCVAAGLLVIALLVRNYLRRKTAIFRVKEEEQKKLRILFEQTATALVNAIDAKDKYTHGHSSRVADYSKKLAQMLGKSEKEVDEIYYAALLHDVGKIGIPASIINKDGKLTDEEYDTIKQHPELGAQILQSIKEYPYLSIGAHFHHERYDGKGYPDGLKGTDIPEIARIVSVADAYDAMTSRRSYRDPIPQHNVREEFVKGSGTQFDPEIARNMLHLIDMDTEYDLQEKVEVRELAGKSELTAYEHRSSVSEGILITDHRVVITMKVSPVDRGAGRSPQPSVILFDSLDGRTYTDERKVRDLLYFEYGEIWFDGSTSREGARKIHTDTVDASGAGTGSGNEYRIEAIKIRDHVLVRITGKKKSTEVTVALPDSARFAYLGLTGTYCRISDVVITRDEEPAPPHSITRIAEEIRYTDGPEGDVPNIQIDGYRTDSTEGIVITDGMKISFHAMSLPTARLVWHCPFINVFTSDNGRVDGENYHDYSLMRLDGECWEGDPGSKISAVVNRNEEFDGWDKWKEECKKGFDCVLSIERKDNTVVVSTENKGILVKNTTIINDGTTELYISLTGDQCVLTNIRIDNAK